METPSGRVAPASRAATRHVGTSRADLPIRRRWWVSHATLRCFVALFNLLLVASAVIGRHSATVGLVSVAVVLVLYLALHELAMRSMRCS